MFFFFNIKTWVRQLSILVSKSLTAPYYGPVAETLIFVLPTSLWLLFVRLVLAEHVTSLFDLTAGCMAGGKIWNWWLCLWGWFRLSKNSLTNRHITLWVSNYWVLQEAPGNTERDSSIDTNTNKFCDKFSDISKKKLLFHSIVGTIQIYLINWRRGKSLWKLIKCPFMD